MNYNFISTVPLETCIGDSLNTFNVNYTSLDLNMKNLSSYVGNGSFYLSSTLQTMSSAKTTEINYLSSETSTLLQQIPEKLNFFNFLSSAPNSSVPVLMLFKESLPYNDVDSGVVASGNGATLAQMPDNTVFNGAKRGRYSTDFQKSRQSSNQVAASDYSVILNGQSNSISGASAQYSFIGSGSNNLISSEYSTILAGTSNSALSTYVSVAGNNNLADKAYCSVLGNNNITFYSASAATNSCAYSPLTASSGSAAQILGSNGLSYYENQMVYSNGCFSRAGDSQYSVFVLRDITTNSVSYMAPIPVATLPGPNYDNATSPSPNFLPIYPRRLWNMRVRITMVTAAGSVGYYDKILVLKRNSSGLVEYNVGDGYGTATFVLSDGTNTSLTLGAFVTPQENCYATIRVASFYAGTSTVYWTAVVEVIESSY